LFGSRIFQFVGIVRPILSLVCVGVVSVSIHQRVLLQGHPSFSGEWELSESAVVGEDGVAFPDGHGHGRMLSQLPKANYSFSVQIRPSTTNLAKVGIRLTRDFGASGAVFGGPLDFRGLSVLLLLNGTSVQAEYRENDSRGRFQESQFFQILDFRLKSSLIQVDFDNKNNHLTISLFCDGFRHMLFSEYDHMPMKKSWLSFTVQSDSIVAFPTFQFGYSPPEPTYQKSRLVLATEVSSASDLIRVIDRFGLSIAGLSHFTHLNDVLFSCLFPFTDAWQRRSLGVVKFTSDLRAKVAEELNATEAGVDGLQRNVTSEIVELLTDVGREIEPLYFSIVAAEFEYNAKLREDKADAFVLSWRELMLLVCMLEGFGVLFYFLGRLCDRPGPTLPVAFQ
jgi:hypothetical protein